eukprot:8483256-Pyramimonas_sp.AAC.1
MQRIIHLLTVSKCFEIVMLPAGTVSPDSPTLRSPPGGAITSHRAHCLQADTMGTLVIASEYARTLEN